MLRREKTKKQNFVRFSANYEARRRWPSFMPFSDHVDAQAIGMTYIHGIADELRHNGTGFGVLTCMILWYVSALPIPA